MMVLLLKYTYIGVLRNSKHYLVMEVHEYGSIYRMSMCNIYIFMVGIVGIA
jgi:hypothetical protein